MRQRRIRRRGMLLLQVITGCFVLALLLGVMVPLYLSSQRLAEMEARKARMQAQAREISAVFSSDVRQAAAVQVGEGGRSLQLTLADVDQPSVARRVRYHLGSGGLTREVRGSNAGALAERVVYDVPLREARFAAAGPSVELRLRFAETVRGRELRYDLNCQATRRNAL